MLAEITGKILKASPWVKFVHIVIFIFPAVLLLVAAWLDITERKQ